MENTGREEPNVSGEIERQTERASWMLMLDSKRLFTSMEAKFTHQFCNSACDTSAIRYMGAP